MDAVSKTAGKFGNMIYSRALINCADTDYVFRDDRRKDMKQGKSETDEVLHSSQCFITYWYIVVKLYKVKLQ